MVISETPVNWAGPWNVLPLDAWFSHFFPYLIMSLGLLRRVQGDIAEPAGQRLTQLLQGRVLLPCLRWLFFASQRQGGLLPKSLLGWKLQGPCRPGGHWHRRRGWGPLRRRKPGVLQEDHWVGKPWASSKGWGEVRSSNLDQQQKLKEKKKTLKMCYQQYDM